MQTAPRIETPRLLLRAPVIEDADAIFEEYAADPTVTHYLTWLAHESKETTAGFLRARINVSKTGKEFSWAITLQGNDRVIGMIDARFQGHRVEIGFVLGQKHWGQGYMTEATTALAKWSLGQHGIFRVWAVCGEERSAPLILIFHKKT
ncbi:GNAT family N-acetyltransferase [Halomonas sp. PR-M31]|uniref:GNAT family N-acetyltransferase n=1 Tax=Halomonas sp. PR-M31 TaxID=1471202 RepID=UPI00069D4B78|nr:GNAT family N-acetyltransferase [Halomonas sp. PR-M31]